ncbi:DUF5071 domain-containing protein [Paenibacillus sp. LMG 31460]|uniref:DUF5071 domain-containing protein n=1 Tax=Paenibacillus germinis TaxID=2654979 RepID=A0ABX1Z8S5_9BACL|nr:DUF5071 domain-containing protein [Paenibacillus germinis]NOU88671.1 DUF5071 domain-containing protein [Paenibacillus germinis]
MEDNVKLLLSSLSWNRPVEEQTYAVKRLISLKDKISDCLITYTSKDQWDNCMKIIIELDYQDQVRMIPQMLFLLRDMNWPGAKEACNLMKNMKVEDLTPYIVLALEQADNECDTIWITWIKTFIEKLNLVKLIEEKSEILKQAEW